MEPTRASVEQLPKARFLKSTNEKKKNPYHYTILGTLTTNPSPKLTFTLTSHLEQNVGLGEG